MVRGLDAGTSNFVAAKMDGDSIGYSRERNAFYVVSPKTRIQSSFLKEGLDKNSTKYFETDDGRIILIGQGSIDYAVTREDKVQRPMAKGVIVAKNKDSIPILSKIMNYVLGPASEENEIVVFSVPAKSVDVKFDVNYHSNTLSSELTKLGYSPKPLNEAEALCYANLIDDGLTGVCFSFGAGCVNMCLMHSGDPIVTFSTAQSGDYIDEMVGYDFDISPTVVQKEKESGIDLFNPEKGNRIQEAIVGRYRVVIKYALENLKYDFERSEKKAFINKPVPVILSGGTSMISGFLELFNQVSSEIGLPFMVSETRRAGDQLYDVAKGCLLAAKMLY